MGELSPGPKAQCEAKALQNHGSCRDEDKEDVSFPIEEGSLMHLYESRLRRLRDYEANVFSAYNNHAINIERPASRRSIVDAQLSSRIVIEPQENPPESSLQRPPSEIDLQHVQNDPDSLDDLTLSTGINSNMETIISRAESAPVSQEAFLAPAPECSPHCEESSDVEDEADEVDEKAPCSIVYSTGSSTEELKNVMFQETSKKGEQPNDGVDDNRFTYIGTSDSNFETYFVLVDRDDDDRAVEIALYSAARPHMRGFHVAWMCFFVAFFTWFAITPLLSEVAVSLTLNREEIWNSSVLAVAGSAVTRILIGPVNDIYGARWTMSATLIISAIPTALSGIAIQSATSLYIIRLLIGVAGSAFVTCQFWSSTMFTPEVAGTANSLAAGWGNLGGGVAQVVMGSLLFPLLKIAYGGEGYGNAGRGYIDDDDELPEYDRASDLAWRTAMLLPAVLCLIMAYICLKYSDDSPKGNFLQRKALGLMQVESAKGAFARSCCKWNTWLLFVQYGCCFGVEITMTNAAALYFQEEFGQTTESAAAIASVFGWMNLFARGIGGFCSDMTSATHGMRGRLGAQLMLLLAEGGLVCLFSTTQSIASAIVVMVIFSVFVQAAEGSTFAIVPYVDCGVTGSVAGVVGAGGNVGGVIFSLLFREFGDRTGFLLMGCVVMMSSLLTAFIFVPGHRGLLKGEDSAEVLAKRDVHAEQFGTLPNVELHTNADDSHGNRQTVLRAETPVATNAPDIADETEEASIMETQEV